MPNNIEIDNVSEHAQHIDKKVLPDGRKTHIPHQSTILHILEEGTLKELAQDDNSTNLLTSPKSHPEDIKWKTACPLLSLSINNASVASSDLLDLRYIKKLRNLNHQSNK